MSNLIGVVCAGGLGTRLYPLTHATNKHLLPVYDKPMIFYPIETLVKAGIKEVVVVTGGPHAGHFIRVLKDGKQLGLDHIYYAFQEKEGGISEAIACAEPYCRGQSIAVVLGDNCTDAEIKEDVDTFEIKNDFVGGGAHIFLRHVLDPQRFGVPVFDEKNQIVAIEEKPHDPKSLYAVTGLYLYDHTVFNRIKGLKPSGRGELEVTDLNNSYLADGKLSWSELKGFWSDAGTFESLLDVANFWRSKK